MVATASLLTRNKIVVPIKGDATASLFFFSEKHKKVLDFLNLLSYNAKALRRKAEQPDKDSKNLEKGS